MNDLNYAFTVDSKQIKRDYTPLSDVSLDWFIVAHVIPLTNSSNLSPL